MAYPKEFSVVLFLLLVALCAYLLCAGKITGQVFLWSLLFCAGSVAIIHNLDLLQRFEFGGGGFKASAEFERIRDDVYAKATAVKEMTESIAGLVAESVATEGRYGGPADPVERQLRAREKLRQTLTAAGTDKDRQNAILAPFAKWILFDLRYAILASVSELESKRGASPDAQNALQSKLEAALNQPQALKGLDEAVEIIDAHRLSSQALKKNIDRYRSFLTADRLPEEAP